MEATSDDQSVNGEWGQALTPTLKSARHVNSDWSQSKPVLCPLLFWPFAGQLLAFVEAGQGLLRPFIGFKPAPASVPFAPFSPFPNNATGPESPMQRTRLNKGATGCWEVHSRTGTLARESRPSSRRFDTFSSKATRPLKSSTQGAGSSISIFNIYLHSSMSDE